MGQLPTIIALVLSVELIMIGRIYEFDMGLCITNYLPIDDNSDHSDNLLESRTHKNDKYFYATEKLLSLEYQYKTE